MNVTNDFIDALVLSVKAAIEKNPLRSDITRNGKITAVNSNGTVSVLMDGKTYIIDAEGDEYSINDVVRVTAPQGNESEMYIATASVLSSRNIYISTVAPASSDGNDGDIWIVYEP